MPLSPALLRSSDCDAPLGLVLCSTTGREDGRIQTTANAQGACTLPGAPAFPGTQACNATSTCDTFAFCQKLTRVSAPKGRGVHPQ